MDLFVVDTNRDEELLDKAIESDSEPDDPEAGKFVRSFQANAESDLCDSSDAEEQTEAGKFVRSFSAQEKPKFVEEEDVEDDGDYSGNLN